MLNVEDGPPVIQPPGSVTVEKNEPAPLLYTAEGKPLVRDHSIGFRGRSLSGVGSE